MITYILWIHEPLKLDLLHFLLSVLKPVQAFYLLFRRPCLTFASFLMWSHVCLCSRQIVTDTYHVSAADVFGDVLLHVSIFLYLACLESEALLFLLQLSLWYLKWCWCGCDAMWHIGSGRMSVGCSTSECVSVCVWVCVCLCLRKDARELPRKLHARVHTQCGGPE